MSIPVERLPERIPGDTFRRVEQTKARLNASTRRFLREETGLRLTVEAAAMGDEPCVGARPAQAWSLEARGNLDVSRRTTTTIWWTRRRRCGGS